jgi:O-methyltransferase
LCLLQKHCERSSKGSRGGRPARLRHAHHRAPGRYTTLADATENNRDGSRDGSCSDGERNRSDNARLNHGGGAGLHGREASFRGKLDRHLRGAGGRARHAGGDCGAGGDFRTRGAHQRRRHGCTGVPRCRARPLQHGAVASTFLAGRTPADLQPFLRLQDLVSYPAWMQLEPVLRGRWAPQQLSPQLQEVFSAGVEALTAGPAQALAAVYNFAAHRRLLDVGGGTGSITAAIAHRHPQIQATVLEQAEVVPLAQRRIQAGGIAVPCRRGGWRRPPRTLPGRPRRSSHRESDALLHARSKSQAAGAGPRSRQRGWQAAPRRFLDGPDAYLTGFSGARGRRVRRAPGTWRRLQRRRGPRLAGGHRMAVPGAAAAGGSHKRSRGGSHIGSVSRGSCESRPVRGIYAG